MGIRQHLETFMAVTTVGRRCYWHTASRDQGCCETAHNAQDSSTTKNDPVHYIRSAEAENPCSITWLLLAPLWSEKKYSTSNAVDSQTFARILQGALGWEALLLGLKDLFYFKKKKGTQIVNTHIKFIYD